MESEKDATVKAEGTAKSNEAASSEREEHENQDAHRPAQDASPDEGLAEAFEQARISNSTTSLKVTGVTGSHVLINSSRTRSPSQTGGGYFPGWHATYASAQGPHQDQPYWQYEEVPGQFWHPAQGDPLSAPPRPHLYANYAGAPGFAPYGQQYPYPHQYNEWGPAYFPAPLQSPAGGFPYYGQPEGPSAQNVRTYASQPTASSETSSNAATKVPSHGRKYGGNPTIPKPAPTATPQYLAQAMRPVKFGAEPQSLLVILDLNGTLGFRPSRNQRILPRLHLAEFAAYLFQHHTVMIWSSAKPENVEGMVKRLLSPAQSDKLAAIWARDKCGLTPSEYLQKVQVFKRLSVVWNELFHARQPRDSGPIWSQANTVLIDDSKLKASSEPYNAIEVPEYDGSARGREAKKNGPEILRQVAAYLEHVRRYEDVSAAMRVRPFKLDDGWNATWDDLAPFVDMTHVGQLKMIQ